VTVELLAEPAELRRWLELDDDDTDALSDERATLLLEGASSSVLAYCRRRTFAEVEDTVTLDGNGAYELLLPGAPVTAVSAVTEDPDGDGTDLLVDVEWSADGILRRTAGGRFVRRFRWYTVTFTHGYETVPEAVRNVVLRVAARGVSNPEGLATEGIGGYNAGFAFDDTRLPTLSAPERRELGPFCL